MEDAMDGPAMDDRNADQIAYWNGPAGRHWTDRQEMQDVVLAPVSGVLIDRAGIAAGARIVDVGCGCGATTRDLASRVGPTGHVLGVDVSAPMLARARELAPSDAPIDFVRADATTHRFEPAWSDLLFSRFGVMFFADPLAAFANIRKALKPHGRLAFVCWRAFVENEWARVPYAAAKPLLPEEPPGDPFAPGPFAFADSGRLRNILDEAGFNDIRINPLDSVMHMGADIEEAAKQATNIGPLARAMNGLDDARREKVRALVKEALAKYRTKDGVSPGAACWLVGATL
jgi:SAM-dependent methyltransferase